MFFIFPQFLLYLMIFPSSTVHLALSNLKNHQILQKVWRKWRKIFQLFYYYLMVAFGTKNVHGAMIKIDVDNGYYMYHNEIFVLYNFFCVQVLFVFLELLIIIVKKNWNMKKKVNKQLISKYLSPIFKSKTNKMANFYNHVNFSVVLCNNV